MGDTGAKARLLLESSKKIELSDRGRLESAGTANPRYLPLPMADDPRFAEKLDPRPKSRRAAAFSRRSAAGSS